jgi:hypothetical protein
METGETTYRTYFGIIDKITTKTPAGRRVEYDLALGARLLLLAGMLAGAVAMQEYGNWKAERETERAMRSLETTMNQTAATPPEQSHLGIFL